jgi:glycosyltransferase involved in cell wall biosynthesis
LKILIAHNRYQQAGGEDSVVQHEVEMLTRRGHVVRRLNFDNDSIQGLGSLAISAIRSFYSRPSYKVASEVMASFRPDVLHVHNFVPTLSPSIFFAAHDANVPVVETLHNYLLICANAQLFRDGMPCEKCLQSHSFLPGVRYACYRGSHVGSAVMGASMSIQEMLGTWRHRVGRFIVLTQFASEKLGGSRVPREKIRIKPNFVIDQGTGNHKGKYALFVGRLSEEKGIRTLLQADTNQRLPFPLKIAGDGPLLVEIQRRSKSAGSQITALGRRSADEIVQLMKDATVLVVPSIWYEGLPMAMVEALSVGLPVIASRIGGLPEIIEDGVSGILFEPGNDASLLNALERIASSMDAKTMSRSARIRYLKTYDEDTNYITLLDIYREVACLPTQHSGHASSSGFELVNPHS